jgi:virulence factor Mce-like protein
VSRTLLRRLYGVAFIAIVIGLVGLTVMIYNKSLPWEHTDKVTLEAAAAGNQLNLGGDVKIRGVIIGDIRSISVQDGMAKIVLGINPGDAKSIPDNVEARILPKTLFGEKFVDLVIPQNPSSVRLHNGSVIKEDRSRTAIETGKVFTDLLPLLRTLQPVKLNETLNALATALESRGNALGDNAVLADRYLANFNPHLATVNHDISGLADLADSLGTSAPDLLRLAENSAVSLQNVVVPQQQTLVRFFRGTQGFADTTRSFLSANENNLIALAANSKPTLGVLRDYSSEFPCLLRGLSDIQPRLEGTFATGPYLYVHLEVINRQGAEYVPGADKPSYKNYGPASCAGLPQPGVKFTYPHPGVHESTVRANEAAVAQTYGDIGPIGSPHEVGLVGAIAGPLSKD